MTQNDWIRQAQNGDVTAITVLLNRAIAAQQMTATLRLTGTTLQIVLTAPEQPDQASAIALIRQGLERLRPTHIRTVQILGQSPNSDQPAWRAQFLLEKPFWEVEEAVAPPEASPPPAAPAPMAIAQTHPPALVRGSVPVLRPKPVTNRAIGALLTGLILAIALVGIGPLTVLFHGFLVLVHELGHALTYWLFGSPALPTVNILYGGGITFSAGQSGVLLALIYGGLGWLAYKLRAYPGWLGVLAGFTLLYSLCLLTPLHIILPILMGHGLECVAIALCLYLALSGYLCRIKGDRAIYAMLGFFTLLRTIQFSWRLGHDPDFRAGYEEGIGGVLDNDLVILANQYLNVDLSAIATAFLIACLAAPIVAFLIFRYEAWWLAGLTKLSHRRAIG